jgi:hypothetical protein
VLYTLQVATLAATRWATSLLPLLTLQVCDCISGLGVKDGSITLDLPLGASLTIIPPKFPTLPQYPW